MSVWFDSLEIRSPSGAPLGLEDFMAGGKRWWDAVHAGDERTQGFGIVAGAAPGYGNMICPGCGASIVIAKNANSVKCAECGAQFRR